MLLPLPAGEPLACRLKYSRWVWLRFTRDMRQETLFRGLAAALVAMAFVPWVLRVRQHEDRHQRA